MNLFEIHDDTPLAMIMLQKLLDQHKVVLMVNRREGVLSLNEIYEVKREGVFSPNAPASIAGTPYTVVAFKAPGYYSWVKPGIGDGYGNGTHPFPHVEEHKYTIEKLPSMDGRVDYIFGLTKYVDEWKKDHADQ